ncbi:efflux RND transporter periplasmic adaptor subunit [Colwellia sp. 20A7]|uniref:efflux RND transporter periplasmic adaptor subunit n=1 Tax=Colwellia sp. 20A7 TaxID=2689569 RepID=UPI00135C1182|nr:efflux RND transporter periplasmic adaptor subunit [Colwellia sp. 20A7]
MARKKQIIIPIAILAIGIGAFIGFSSMKKPPEEKAEVDNRPIVAVENITVMPMTLEVSSYGVVKPKYETTIVAQVSGEVVELSDKFVRGGLVKKGQLLARIDPNDYHAALIDAQANMASARAALETEVAQGKVAEQEWQQITDTSPTELSLRKPQLAQELANVKSAQAAILRAERNLQRTEVRAPYDAMINSRTIGLGSFVGVGSEIGMLLGSAIAEVRLPVADNQLQFLIDQGLKSTVNLSGTFAGEELQWQAEIVRSEGVVDDNSRMTYLVAEIKDPYYLNHSNTAHDLPLRFGSYVKAKILGMTIENASVVPQYLVDNNQVALLDSESELHYAVVNVIRQEGGNVVINKGLLDGDQLITSSLDYPVEGMKLALINEEEAQNDDVATSLETAEVVINENEGE